MTAGEKQKPKAGVVVPGTINTSRANTSVPAEPVQSYWEKKGSASPLTGDRSTDAVHVITSTLNGPISSQNALNAIMLLCQILRRTNINNASYGFSLSQSVTTEFASLSDEESARTLGVLMSFGRKKGLI